MSKSKSIKSRRRIIKYRILNKLVFDYISKNFSVLFRYSILLLIILLYEKSLIGFFQKSYLGEIFFSFNEGVLIIDLLLILAGIITIVYFYRKGKIRYKYSLNYYLFIFFITSYYLSFRLSPARLYNHNIELVELKSISLPYLDLLFGFLILGMIIFRVSNKKKILINPSTSLTEDNPIVRLSEDNIGYFKLANKIVDEIFGLSCTEQTFNVGIDGNWGSGKTSMIYLIERILEKKKNKHKSDHIYIKFSPLLINKSSNLTVNFLLSLNNELKKL